MLRKALLRTAIATFLLASAIQAQTLDQTLSGCNGAAPLQTITATPSDYRSKIAGLIPGDRLLLAAGTYTQGLPLWNKHGQAGKCIVVEGPATGSPALFTGVSGANIISLKDSSYIALRNLSLNGQGTGSDGVKAEATSVSVHHILIDGLSLTNFNLNQNQQIVGISTKCPAWNWVVRRTTITNAGTGMYFGDSSGGYELSNSLIEHNLVHTTLGYNAQFKHQLSRSTAVGAPSSGTVIIRHNVFSKETGSSTGVNDVRPNLLVGHWPLSGAGSTDIYQIYGNLFYLNPTDALFQGEGNIALHDNLFVSRTGTAVRIRPHNSVPRRIEAFNNTVVASTNGIYITGADTAYTQRVVGNAVFAGTPLTGGQQSSNVTGTSAQAATYLNNPTAALGSGLDLYPKSGQLQGTAINHSVFAGLLDYDRDFNSRSRISTYRGAYSGDGVNPGWTPALAIKPVPPAGGVLQNGVPVTGLAGAQGSQQFWTMSVPSGATNLQFQTSGGTGNANLYVRYGSAPNLTTWDCRPLLSGNSETCSFASPSAGSWHVMLDAATAYSGVTLTGSYSTCNSISDVEPNNSMSAPQVISGSCNQISGTFLNDASTQQHDYFRVSLPAGATVTALLNGLTVDYDLEIYDAAGNYVAWSYNGGATPDQASWTNTTASAMNVYVLVYRASSTRTTYQLRVSY
ncbi:MAG TPA: pre-peptidase C-terminal domain-containing protein [Thermoanaerobaculia bacterium]|nr:pre-peptidase C-terminal domain-containing protein [Thermoanaerobaculia bacterium]